MPAVDADAAEHSAAFDDGHGLPAFAEAMAAFWSTDPITTMSHLYHRPHEMLTVELPVTPSSTEGSSIGCDVPRPTGAGSQRGIFMTKYRGQFELKLPQ